MLVRDHGNVRSKPAYFFVICFSLFVVFVLMLHYRDKTLKKNLAEAEAEHGLGRRPDRWPSTCRSSLMLVLAVVFGAISRVASKLLGPRNPTAAKSAPYECGIMPDREPPERFPVKFFLVAMIFIVFDIEIIFLFPWAIVFRELGAVRARSPSLIFAAAVFESFVYLIGNGALDWGPVKRLRRVDVGRPDPHLGLHDPPGRPRRSRPGRRHRPPGHARGGLGGGRRRVPRQGPRGPQPQLPHRARSRTS